MPLVSVIIPCYNASGYIGNCLKALEQQSFRDFDVILVDDCSTDDTVQAIQSFCAGSDMHITLLYNEENAGPGVSRNFGIRHSDSEYVCFCDSDDWYEPDYLEQMVEASRNGLADMVLCNSRKVTARGTADILLLKNVPSDVSVRQVLALGVDSLGCMMVRREIAAATPQPMLRNGEDMAVIPLMIMQCGQFGFVEKCIYNYLCRPGSLSLSACARVVTMLEQSFSYITASQRPGFEREVEFIGIKNLVYGGLLNYFKAEKKGMPARQLLERFEAQYPQWYENPYRKGLPLFKRVFVLFAKLRWFMPLRAMCWIHRWLTERG